MPDPKVVIAVGTDAVSGGLLSQSETVTAGVAATVPVDVFLPGSPPSPFSILNALLIAVGQLAYGGKGGPASQRAPAPTGLTSEERARREGGASKGARRRAGETP